jgi:hypothetical protein
MGWDRNYNRAENNWNRGILPLQIDGCIVAIDPCLCKVEQTNGVVSSVQNRANYQYDARVVAAANSPLLDDDNSNSYPTLVFGGVDDYLKIPRMTNQFANGFSYFVVLKCDDGRPATAGSIFGSFTTTSNNNAAFYCYNLTDGNIRTGIFSNNTDSRIDVVKLADGASSYFIVSAICDPTSTYKGYYNGAPGVTASKDISNVSYSYIFGGTRNATTEQITIGNRIRENDLPQPGNYFDGNISCFYLYNKPISQMNHDSICDWLNNRFNIGVK